jgi:DNA repair exonuclease SbcCD ATPase subunit
MEDNCLGNYRSDLSQISDTPEAGAEEIQAAMHHQEVNTLKIEKLSNRVTIISVILPCIIIAVLAFAYLDMKERVVDVNETKGSQVAHLAAQLDEKLNALDVRIAEVKFTLDETLPEMENNAFALENQVAKLSGDKADNKAVQAKADKKAVQAMANKLDKRIKTNAGQDKTTLATMERINQDLLAAIKENNTQFKSKSNEIMQEMQLFREEFDARLMELSVYEQQLAQLSKSLSLLDKQVKTLKADVEKRTEYRVDQLRLLMEDRIKKLESDLAETPVPQVDTPTAESEAPDREPASDATISEETLIQ